MADRMTPEQRHRCMAAIKGKNTRPEIIVRKFLFANGLRFRIHDRRLPGTPDIVLPKFRTAIFINGCFWHGHKGCRSSHLPTTNNTFWQRKINLNKARDMRVAVELRLRGWRVIRLWECGLKNKETSEATLQTLLRTILTPTPATPATPAVATDPDPLPVPGYTPPLAPPATAAEPPAPYGTPPSSDA